MRLLLVDDEDTTREGILERLPWKEMGVEHVDQADDGINGLTSAALHAPDIILTDVRMPRMDGVEMSFRLREQLPDCKIIFMSGYSDKEYLKSAIRLKAVNYIEKPINLTELKSAVEAAVSLCSEEKARRENEQELTQKLHAGISLIRSELSLLLTNPAVQRTQLEEKLKLASLSLPMDGLYWTVLVKFVWGDNPSLHDIHSMRESIPVLLDTVCHESGLQAISGMKDEGVLVVHLYAAVSDRHMLTQEKVRSFCGKLCDALPGPARFFICIGKKVQGMMNVPHSYNGAVLVLQRCFFRSYGSIVEYDDCNAPPYEFNPRLVAAFGELLSAGNMEQSVFLVKRLTSDIRRYENTLVAQIRNFYFRLLLELEKHARQLDIRLMPGFTGENELWEQLLKLNTLSEIESFTASRLDVFFRLQKSRLESCDPIIKITRYIQDRYADETISISSISEHTYLSPTYLCALFKEKTGKTLNQYITEYRMEKARELLCQREYKVSDIAVMVGLGDGNYFAKIFRKTTGMTPTEYRERYL